MSQDTVKSAVQEPTGLNETLDDIARTGKVVDKEGNLFEAFPTSIPFNDGKALYDCVMKHRAQRTLEIGCAYGISTLFICQALRDLGGGSHTALDPFQKEEYKDIGLANVERAGFEDLFTFHKTFSQDHLPSYLINGDTFDFIFIDGHHTFEQVMLDFYYAEKIIKVGGHIMLHDVNFASVRKALTFILRNQNFEVDMGDLLQEPSSLGHIYTFLRMALKNPLDPLTWKPMYKIWSQANVCILRRTQEDTRSFAHYTPF